VSVLAAAVLGVSLGPASLAPFEVIKEILGSAIGLDHPSTLTPLQRDIVWSIRVPRVVLGGLVGSMLAVAGASYQGVFRNPLADPYLLGAAAGAGLGATIVIGAQGATIGLPVAAFLGATGAVAITYTIGSSLGGRSTTTLILAGVAVASFLTAVQTYLQQRNVDTVRQVYAWILGRLSTSGWSEVQLLAPYVTVCTLVLLFHRRLLDVLSVGDLEAASLGVEVARVRLVVVLAATLGTAAAVAVSGLIGFVGIVVPHAVRLVVGPSHRSLLPLSFLFGAAFLMVADLAARTVVAPGELPIGVITAFVGAPFFAIVLRTSRRVFA
jgi:iron complex transport system permease protein